DRNVQCCCDGGKRGWERREKHHDDEYQPDVIRFPNRANRLRNQCSLFARASSKRKQVPHATAVIRTAEECIQNECSHHHAGDNRFKRQVAPPSDLLRCLVDLPRPAAVTTKPWRSRAVCRAK